MIYRTEHPKPQFMRENWCNLNGQWQFEIDHGNSGEARTLYDPKAVYSQSINVPFCPESKLSGVEYKDFMQSVWYKRTFTVTPQQLQNCVKLHFGAVDYFATVYINGEKCGTHKGGYVSFCFDITEFLHPGENTVTVHAEDDTRSRAIPSGKQSEQYHSYGCYYTRTTGIWQTVWLEFLPQTHIESVKYYTEPSAGQLSIHAQLAGAGTLKAEAYFEGQFMGSGEVESHGGLTVLNILLSQTHLWEVGKGGLYDLVLTYGEDTVQSYFGMRSVSIDGYKFLLNGKSVFQRTILDQGFYPDGIYTAPSDAELLADVERSMAMGFNGARLHEKVFEERFLYHCDRLGYLVWGEYPDWGLDVSLPENIYNMLPAWMEEIKRDFNHPALIGWCPFNETYNDAWVKKGNRQYDELISTVYHVTKALDSTRPCIDASGYLHVVTDIFDLHKYDQEPEALKATLDPIGKSNRFAVGGEGWPVQQYDGKMPFFVSEYGGIRWTADQSGWGYGNAPKTPEEFLTRLKALTDVLMDHPQIMGLCYTQLTDVEQEQNGLYTYDRKAKFPPEVIAPIFTRKAAIEE